MSVATQGVLFLATEKQANFIVKLRTERNMPALTVEDILTWAKGSASSEIAELLAMPKPAVKKTHKTVAPGMYVKDGKIYRVKLSEAGRTYAQELVGKTFSYAPGAVLRLSETDRMSLDQAKAYGLKTGVCCVCGRVLTNAVSVAEGIGPICSGRL